jgi:hypothetical protein
MLNKTKRRDMLNNKHPRHAKHEFPRYAKHKPLDMLKTTHKSQHMLKQ